MKILKNPGPWKKHMNCPCGAKLLIEAADVHKGYFGGNYLEDGDLLPYVTCPLCDRNLSFPWRDLPPNIERKLYGRKDAA